jgi:osmoprotectant transport system ATP-binding protein
MALSLTATNVSHWFGDTVALDGVSLEVPAGHAVALVGESGSGKTTLLRTFNRMIAAQRGVIKVGDTDVRTMDPVELRRRIGYVQQNGGLLPHWTIGQNVGLVLRAAGASTRDDEYRDRVAECLTFVGLDTVKFSWRYPRELSGGQRQRVALARALAAKPDALLLDEPFGALDAISKSEVQEAFDRARRTLGLTTILVTHDIAEAARLGDTVAVMRSGKIEQRGSMATLREKPATNYVRALLTRAREQLAAVKA